MADDDTIGAWMHRHPRAVDRCLAVLVLLAFEMPAFDPYRHAGGPWWPLWGVAIAAGLLWRRRAPVGVVLVTLAAAMGAMLTRTGPDWGGLGVTSLLLGPAVALATAASSCEPRVSARLALLFTAVVVAGGSLNGYSTPDVVVAQGLCAAAAWLAGQGIRARRHEVVLLRDRVAREAELAAHDERNRIARELHDLVAHHLSVISLHAGAARLRTADGQERDALVTIEDEARRAAAELRQALGVLRHDGGAGGLDPQPHVDQVERLVERLGRAGLPVTLVVAGDLATVPEGPSVSAYRIVQEALTNVLRHAGRVDTTVAITVGEHELGLRVRNGPPTTPARGRDADGTVGFGLVGMRERAAAVGGSVTALDLPAGGFEVAALVPLP